MYPEKRWQDLLKVLLILSTDFVPKKIDAIYLPGLSSGMMEFCGLFDHISQLSNNAIPICFNGSDGRGMGERNYPEAAWPGRKYYIEEFQKRGVSADLLIPTRDGLHSRDEVDAFIELSRDLGFKNVAMTTVPYHYPRTFVCLIKAMEQTKYSVNAYALPPATHTKNWWQEILGSQGAVTTVPFDECMADFERVFIYQDKGFGSSFEDLLNYLKIRD